MVFKVWGRKESKPNTAQGGETMGKRKRNYTLGLGTGEGEVVWYTGRSIVGFDRSILYRNKYKNQTKSRGDPRRGERLSLITSAAIFVNSVLKRQYDSNPQNSSGGEGVSAHGELLFKP